MSDLPALDFFNKLLVVLVAFSTFQFITLWVIKRTGNTFHVVIGRKLMKLIGVEWWTIVAYQLIRDSMPRVVSL